MTIDAFYVGTCFAVLHVRGSGNEKPAAHSPGVGKSERGFDGLKRVVSSSRSAQGDISLTLTLGHLTPSL